MDRKGIIHYMLCGCIAIAVFTACKSGTETSEQFDLNIRIPNEPESLHPMLSKSSYGTQITGHILLPAAEFDPVSLQLSPLLITSIPEAEHVTDGIHAGGKMYKIEFRPEATWDNGAPVTAHDYLFTIKSVFNPHVNAPGWRGFLSYITEVDIDESNPKKATVYIDSSYILALEIVTNFNIYPAHIYDPENVMSVFTLQQLQQTKEWTPEQDNALMTFANQFQSVKYLRETVEGSGPYTFDGWTTGEFIRLKRKENWWGDKLTDPPLLLQAYPHSMTYRIITDAATAEAALKSGQVDVISEVLPSSFMKLKSDPEWTDNFTFESPSLLQIYYLELNHRDPVLGDKNIRKALAYSIDYDGIMQNLLVGLGQRAIGPIHPQRSYYHKGLKPIEQDINRSLSLIKEAGWEDTNNNGTPDKILNGKREELQVTLKIPNKEEGQTLANIVRENAKKAGFDIVIEAVDPSQFNQDMRQFNFEMIPVRARSWPSADELYQTWHSENDQAGGGNRSGFRHAAADEAMMEIRTAESTAERDSNYLELQEIMYEEQPGIFLYVPLERIVVSKKYEFITSSRKPGYFENLFKLRS